MPSKPKKKNVNKKIAKKPAAKKIVKAVKSLKKVVKKAPRKVSKRSVQVRAADKAKAQASGSQNLSVYDMNGKPHETVAVDAIFQGEKINTNILYQAILKYQAGQREGTAATKTRGEVSGGGKKPWKQKGTGQARHGSRRSPIWRGGSVVFGPHPRDYSYTLPLKIRRSAVVEVIKDKILNGKFLLVKSLDLKEAKTRLVAAILETFKLEKPLFLVEKKSDVLLLASRNISTVSVKTADEVNALDVALHRECLVEKSAYSGLIKRLKS